MKKNDRNETEVLLNVKYWDCIEGIGLSYNTILHHCLLAYIIIVVLKCDWLIRRKDFEEYSFGKDPVHEEKKVK